MTKAKISEWVKRSYSELAPDLQDMAAQRLLGVSVFWWDGLTLEQLRRLYAICRTLQLVHMGQS